MEDTALARENEALRVELARMRAYMSGMQHGKGRESSTPASPSRTAKKATFLGTELARMRAYMSAGMHHSKGSGPSRTAAKTKASLLGSVSQQDAGEREGDRGLLDLGTLNYNLRGYRK